MKKALTLCILQQDNKVLLGMKKRGFGEGRWNGFGGKVHEDETIEEAVIREMKEEACITVKDIRKHGIIEFRFEEDLSETLEVHIFKSTQYSGAPKETEEMLPKWFDIKDIPYEEMWSDDKYWLPELLEGKCFSGEFLFSPGDKVKDYTFNIIQCTTVE